MDQTLSLGGLFLEGLLSFFSPCVLPLIPLYIGYLTADTISRNEDGTVTYDRLRTALSTVCFCLGICTVFFLMAAGAGALNNFFSSFDIEIRIIGGILLIFLGLISFGFIRVPFLEQERRFNFRKGKNRYLNAWIMGFFFSFAWSPCIGPMLSGAIIASLAADTAMQGYLLIASYSAGFIIMFLVLGLFTEEVLVFLQKHRDIVKYTQKIGAAVLILMGGWMLRGSFQTIRLLQNNASQAPVAAGAGTSGDTAAAEEGGTDSEKYGFSLPNAEGEIVSLTDYTGKTILVNFFATWCTYCNMEMPDLQNIEETRDDVKILLIAAPDYGEEKDIGYIENFMQEKGYSMEILYDTSLSVNRDYGVSGYPMTYIVKPDGNFLGYIPGYADKESIEHYIAVAKGEE